jgi:hypothetical protein
MTATLEISPLELDLRELDEQDVELLPTRETLCGWNCYPCHPVYYCHPCYVPCWSPKWCYG